jgi:hypothetical protein
LAGLCQCNGKGIQMLDDSSLILMKRRQLG